MNVLKVRQIALLGSALCLSMATAQPAFAQKSYRVCKSVPHCVDILERHSSESFDYTVLADNFSRFSDKGRQLLLDIAGQNQNPDLARRAFELMALGEFKWTPAEQSKLTSLWPQYHTDLLTPVLETFKSEAVRNKAVATLNHRDKSAQSAARTLIASSMIDGMKAPLPPALIPQLAKALASAPTIALIDMAALLPEPQASELIIPVLKSGETELTRHAYQRLFDIKPEIAFNSLLKALFSLQPNEFQAGLALSDMLRVRHGLRPDGFYLRFAGDIAKDAKFNPVARFVGLDVVLRSPEKVNIEQDAVFFQTLKTGMDGFAKLTKTGQNQTGVPYAYLARFSEMQTPQTAESWVSLLKSGYGAAEPKLSSYPEFIARLGEVKTELSQDLVGKAMGEESDYNLISAALLAFAKQNFSVTQNQNSKDGFTARLENLLSGHPVTQVRLAAKKSKDIVAGKKDSRAAFEIYNTISHPLSAGKKSVNRPAQYCQVSALDYREISRGMPYFDQAQYKDGSFTRRSELRSATELGSGWLAAYSRQDKVRGGGLFYFDNKTGKGTRLLDDDVRLVVPTQKYPFGQYSQSYWVLSYPELGENSSDNHERLYRAEITPQGAKVTLHSVMPQQAQNVGLSPRGWLEIDFVPAQRPRNISALSYNPPLTWTPKGELRAKCKPTAAPGASGAP